MASPKTMLERTEFTMLVEKVQYPFVNELFHHLDYNASKAHWAVIFWDMFVTLFENLCIVGTSPVSRKLAVE